MTGRPDPATEDVEGSCLALSPVRPAPPGHRDGMRKVATVLTVVVSTSDDGVHTASALLRPVSHGAEAVGGWVLVTAGDALLAQGHVKAGRAELSWTDPDPRTVVVSYTGDELHAPAARTLEP